MMKNNIITVSLLALVLTAVSCGPLGKYKNETKVDPNLYGKNVTIAPGDSSMALVSWDKVFTDPCLKSLIDTALARNLDLAMAQEHIAQARTQLTSARLAYAPSLNIAPSVKANFTNTGNSYAFNVFAESSWQIDICGKMANNVKKAKVTIEQAKDYRQAVLVDLIANVANTYYTLLMLDSELAISREMELVWQKSVQTVYALKREGFADEVAVNQYIATYKSVQLKAIEFQKLIDQTENAMSVLLGSKPSSIKRGKLVSQSLPEHLTTGVPVTMLQLRPDVRAAQRQVEMAFYTTKDAWLNFFPSLTITGNPMGLSGGFRGEPLSFLANLSASLVAPVFNFGINKAKLKYAESAQREAKMSLDKALLVSAKEVNDALMEYNACTEKMNHYATQVKSLAQARADTELLMKNDEGKTYLDVLTAHNSLINAQFEQVQNSARRMQAVVSFYQALGGGVIGPAAL